MAVTVTYSIANIVAEFGVNETTAGNQTDVALAELENGNIVFAFVDDETVAPNSNILGRIFSPTGTPVTGDFVIQSGASDREVKPSLAATNDGGFIAAWQDSAVTGSAGGESAVWRQFSATGVGSGPVNFLGNFPSDQGMPLLSNNPIDGTVYAAIYVGQPDSANTSVRRESIGGTPSTFTVVRPSPTGMTDMAFTALPNGGVAIALAMQSLTGTDWDIFLVMSDGINAGSTVSTFIGTDSGNERRPSIAALPDGSVVVAWEDELFSDPAQASVERVHVSAAGVVTVLNSITDTGRQSQPHVFTLGGGLHGITYTSNASGHDDVLMRIYDGDTLIASQTVDAPAGAQNDAFTRSLGEGRLATAWTDVGPDGSGSRISAQIDEVRRFTTGDGAPDVAIGDDLPDIMNGGGGADELRGAGGADSILGGTGNDTLDGGAQNDTLMGEAGRDLINGGDGHDSIWGNTQIAPTGSSDGDTLSGDDGNDSVVGADGADVLFGGAGNDTLRGNAGADSIYGGAGNDSMVGGTGNDHFVVLNLGDIAVENAAAGDDTSWVGISGWTNGAEIEIVRMFDSAASVTGSGSNEQIVANAGLGAGSVLNGAGGDDVLWGSAFADTLDGGGGNDIFRGGAGADSMIGGLGVDIFVVEELGDVIVEAVGGGFDTAYITVDNYVLPESGGAFAANLEVAYLAGTAVFLNGSSSGENMVANPTAGSVLAGFGGNDILYGSNFGDSFTGGTGGDQLNGYGGADQFRFVEAAWGQDIIWDFASAQGDKLVFSAASGVTAFGQLTQGTQGGWLLLSFGGNSILLNGVTGITAADVVFV